MDVDNVKLKIALITAIKDTVIVCCRNWIQYEHLLTLNGKLRISFDEEKALVVQFNEKLSIGESSVVSAETTGVIASLSESSAAQAESTSLTSLQPYFLVEGNENSNVSDDAESELFVTAADMSLTLMRLTKAPRSKKRGPDEATAGQTDVDEGGTEVAEDTIKMKPAYNCPKCGMAFSHKRSMIRHATSRCRQLSDIGSLWKSRLGGRPKKSDTVAAKKKKTVTQFYTYECSECKKVFSSEQEIQDHIREHSEPPVGGITCSTCKKTFATAEELTTHIEQDHLGPAVAEKPAKAKAAISKSSAAKSKQDDGDVATVFRCAKCDKTFDNRTLFRRHMKMHDKEEVRRERKRQKCWCCAACGKSFLKQFFLKRHMESHERQRRKKLGQPPDKRFECEVCHKMFTTERYRDIHCEQHSKGGPNECTVCNKKFITVTALRKHEVMHLTGVTATEGELDSGAVGESGKLECSVCGKLVAHEYSLKIHVARMHAPDREVCRCDQCGRTCVSLMSLERHKKLHGTSGEPLICPTCGKWFSHAALLKVHIEDHTTELKCEICDRVFYGRRALKAHSQAHRQRHVCEPCQKSFRNAELLKAHLRDHHGQEDKDEAAANTQDAAAAAEDGVPVSSAPVVKKTKQRRRYKCEQCGKSFPAIYHLQAHMNSHTGDRPFQCQICGKCYTTNSALRCHAVTHTGLRPYQCRTCQMTFTNLSNLSKHRRCHDPNMQYVCKVCGQRFAYRWSWQQHEKGHLGLKPYLCNVCGKSFTQACTLRGHQKTHEREDEAVMPLSGSAGAAALSSESVAGVSKRRKSSVAKKRFAASAVVPAEDSSNRRDVDSLQHVGVESQSPQPPPPSHFALVAEQQASQLSAANRDSSLPGSGLLFPYRMTSEAQAMLPPIEYAGIIPHPLPPPPPSHSVIPFIPADRRYHHMTAPPQQNLYGHYANGRFENPYM